MALPYAGRFSTTADDQYATVSGDGGASMQFPRAMWDQAITDWNAKNGPRTDLDMIEAGYNDPTSGYYQHPVLTPDWVAAERAKDATRQSYQIDPNNITADQNATLSANLISPSYGNADDYFFNARDAAVKADAKANSKAHMGKFLGIAGGAASLVGGLALAPALSGTVAGAGSGFGNFATGAAIKGALGGAASGLASGQGVGGALKGAALGGLTGGYGGAIGSSLGLSGPGLSAFQGGLSGAAGGVANGDTKNALLGAALGGAGGYVTGGGLGDVAGTPLDQASGVVGAQGPTQGTGIVGSITRNIPSGITSALTGGFTEDKGGLGGLGDLKSYIKPVASLYGGYQNNQALSDAEKELLAGNNQAAGVLNPYVQSGTAANNQLSAALAAGFNPGDLTSDPGYQFRLQEGQKGLDRSLAASGMSQSGRAIKAAQQYSQGLASTEYGDAYQRWLANNGQLQTASNAGQNAATNVGNIYSNSGNVKAATALGKAENKNKTLAALLSAFGVA